MIYTDYVPDNLDAFEQYEEEQERRRMVEGRFHSSGWVEKETGVFVPEEDAFDYAIEQCVKVVPDGFRRIKWTQEFKDMLTEWFFSGNWVKED